MSNFELPRSNRVIPFLSSSLGLGPPQTDPWWVTAEGEFADTLESELARRRPVGVVGEQSEDEPLSKSSLLTAAIAWGQWVPLEVPCRLVGGVRVRDHAKRSAAMMVLDLTLTPQQPETFPWWFGSPEQIDGQ